MDLREAKLCLDCEELYIGKRCPRCGSEVCWWLSKFVPVMKGRRKQAGADPASPGGYAAAREVKACRI
ncbi:MAG: hypothetical protein JXL84_15015 [Deltaproteobacteria bacterium]|nr:hypothetical protein [Deltaproteobacteria bacterium]